MADDLAKIKARLHGGLTKLPNDDRPSVISQAKTKAAEAADALLKAHARQEALQKLAFEPNSVTKVRDPQALSEMASDMLAGPLGFMPAGIIKQKGGQWLKDSDYLEYVIQNLKENLHRNPTQENEMALQKWIDSNLKNYIKNQMGTKEDPVRALAEQGISHLPPNSAYESVAENAIKNRIFGGMPHYSKAEHPLAEQWENIADASIQPIKAEVFQKPFGTIAERRLGQNRWGEAVQNSPWLQKLEPNTNVHTATVNMEYDTGFDHILDVLNQQLASGALRPDQLNKISAADAVQRAHLFNQEMAKKMAKEKLQQQAELPLHKDYGESGFKWYELKHPTKPEMTEEALKYEGNTMGHCVGGYCPDVLEGRTKIYSLRDAKGEPHVTIEVQPQGLNLKFSDFVKTLGHEKTNELIDHPNWSSNLTDRKNLIRDYFKEAGVDLPAEQHKIIQIKGKQNDAPKAEYIPYVQDFVKSGNWSDVGDLYNAKLFDSSDMSRLADIYPSNELLQDLDRNVRFSLLNKAKKEGSYPLNRFITKDEYENLLLQNKPPEVLD